MRVKKQVCDLGNKSSGEHLESADGQSGLIVKCSPSKAPPLIATGSRFRAHVNCKNSNRSAPEKLSRAAQKCCTQASSAEMDSYLVQERNMRMSSSSTPHTTSRSCFHEKSERCSTGTISDKPAYTASICMLLSRSRKLAASAMYWDRFAIVTRMDFPCGNRSTVRVSKAEMQKPECSRISSRSSCDVACLMLCSWRCSSKSNSRT